MGVLQRAVAPKRGTHLFGACCYFGIWEVTYPVGDMDSFLKRISEDRHEDCFFYAHKEQTPFDVAQELERRAREQREARRLTTRNIVWAMIIALVSAAAGSLITWLLKPHS